MRRNEETTWDANYLVAVLLRRRRFLLVEANTFFDKSEVSHVDISEVSHVDNSEVSQGGYGDAVITVRLFDRFSRPASVNHAGVRLELGDSGDAVTTVEHPPSTGAISGSTPVPIRNTLVTAESVGNGTKATGA